MMATVRAIIEALLFVSEVPLSLGKIKELLSMYTHREITAALDDLRQEYSGDGHGFMVGEVAQGYQLRTKPEYAGWVRKLTKMIPTRLSRAALETLAIVAYKQPIVRSEIEAIRGVDAGGVLHLLMEKSLIKIMGRKNVPGRPFLYGTTQRFLEVFSLQDLSSLPSLKELEGFAPVSSGGESGAEEGEEKDEPGEQGGESPDRPSSPGGGEGKVEGDGP
jgi:segregation and condensation protein B